MEIDPTPHHQLAAKKKEKKKKRRGRSSLESDASDLRKTVNPPEKEEGKGDTVGCRSYRHRMWRGGKKKIPIFRNSLPDIAEKTRQENLDPNQEERKKSERRKVYYILRVCKSLVRREERGKEETTPIIIKIERSNG